jgi:hypothetical protein
MSSLTTKKRLPAKGLVPIFRILTSPSLCNSVHILNSHFVSSYYLFYTTCFGLKGHHNVYKIVVENGSSAVTLLYFEHRRWSENPKRNTQCNRMLQYNIIKFSSQILHQFSSQASKMAKKLHFSAQVHYSLFQSNVSYKFILCLLKTNEIIFPMVYLILKYSTGLFSRSSH